MLTLGEKGALRNAWQVWKSEVAAGDHWRMTAGDLLQPWAVVRFLASLAHIASLAPLYSREPDSATAAAAVMAYGPPGLDPPDEVCRSSKKLLKRHVARTGLSDRLQEATETTSATVEEPLIRFVEGIALQGVNPKSNWPGLWASPWPEAERLVTELVEIAARPWIEWIVNVVEERPEGRAAAVEENARRSLDSLREYFTPDFRDVYLRTIPSRKGLSSYNTKAKRNSLVAGVKECRTRFRQRVFRMWPGKQPLDKWIAFALGTVDSPGVWLENFQKGLLAMVYRSADGRKICVGPVLKVPHGSEIDPLSNRGNSGHRTQVLKPTPRWVWLERDRAELPCSRCASQPGDDDPGNLYFGDHCPFRKDHDSCSGCDASGRSTGDWKKRRKVWVHADACAGGFCGVPNKGSFLPTCSWQAVEELVDAISGLEEPERELAVEVFLKGRAIAEVLQSVLVIRRAPDPHTAWAQPHEHWREVFCSLAAPEPAPAEASPLQDWFDDLREWLPKPFSLIETLNVRVDTIIDKIDDLDPNARSLFDALVASFPTRAAPPPALDALAEDLAEVLDTHVDDSISTAVGWMAIDGRVDEVKQEYRTET